MDNNILNKRPEWTFGESSNDEDVLIFTNDGTILPIFISLDSTYAEHFRNKEKRIKEAALLCKAVNNYDSLLADNERLNIAFKEAVDEVIYWKTKFEKYESLVPMLKEAEKTIEYLHKNISDKNTHFQTESCANFCRSEIMAAIKKAEQ